MVITLSSFVTLAIIAVNKISSLKEPGLDSVALVEAVQQGERLNFYIDQSAKYAMKQSVFELAQKGGYSVDSSCGNYNGHAIWYDKGKFCLPNAPLEELKVIFGNKLDNYLAAYPNLNLPKNNYDFSMAENKIIATAKKEISIRGSALSAVKGEIGAEGKTFANIKDITLMGYDCKITEFHDTESVGFPAFGRLKNPANIEKDTPYYYSNTYSRDRNYGTAEIINLIEKTGCIAINVLGKDARLLVHDLSTKEGGEIKPHDSHQSGRDVDIGLFKRENSKLNNVFEDLTLNIGLFDAQANWILVKALFLSANIDVIFLDSQLINKLQQYASVNEPDKEMVSLIFSKLKQWPGHEHHYHVRIHCSNDDRMCLEQMPKDKEQYLVEMKKYIGGIA